MYAKFAKTPRHRLSGVNLCNVIRGLKNTLGLPYSTIAGWMGITTSNLTSMISQGLNPYPEQWEAFKVGVKCHADSTTMLVGIPLSKVDTCAYRNCNETIILWAHNKKYCCPNHSKLERRIQIYAKNI